MKKLVVAALLVSAAIINTNASAWFGRGGSGCNGCRTRTCNVETTCEPRPICYKMVRKECPARKVCNTKCWYVCPPDTIREECNGEEGMME
jgi:hypothetical protein